MSRAFVKEPDGEEVASDLPDRPISAHRNFVTAAGLAHIDAEIDRFRSDLVRAQAKDDKPAIAAAARDMRYWTKRRASAELVTSPTGAEIRFGTILTIERGDGRQQTFQITGEDEADPTVGKLSYVSPLARALLNKRAGDEITFLGDTIAVLVVG